MIVADANIIIYLVRESSFTEMARAAYAKDSHWIVPELWEAEVLNGLLQEVRASHIDLDAAILAASNAAEVLSGNTHKLSRSSVLEIAHRARLTAYDACYVALARSLNIPLLTEDGAIRRNCPDVACSLKEYLGVADGTASVREKSEVYRVRRKNVK